ncbi:hypothetical protein [Actinospica robiniae]|uniref:hypothetical protein n=1 Tax=Actinospica robiniae TaxID=304901 RepID=UPI000422B1B7|nr:hypothetical protein [Actinospica robiniae]
MTIVLAAGTAAPSPFSRRHTAARSRVGSDGMRSTSTSDPVADSTQCGSSAMGDTRLHGSSN